MLTAAEAALGLVSLTAAGWCTWRPRHLKGDRALAAVLAAAGIAILSRNPALEAWAVTHHAAAAPETIKHTALAIGMCAVIVYIAPTRARRRRIALWAAVLAAVVMPVSVLVFGPFPEPDLEITGYRKLGMTAYWSILYGYALGGAVLMVHTIATGVRRRSPVARPTSYLLPALAAAVMGVWAAAGAYAWVTASTPQPVFAVAAAAAVGLCLALPVLAALYRRWSQRHGLATLLAHLTGQMDVDHRTATPHVLLMRAHDALSLARAPFSDDVAELLEAMRAAGDASHSRDAVLIRHGARLARTHRVDAIARALSAGLQPVISIPTGFALLGALLGGHHPWRWAIVLPLSMAAPPLILVAIVRLAGRASTLRITGRLRVLLLAGGMALQVIAIMVLAQLEAPAPIVATLFGGVAGVVALAAAQLRTSASAHTSVLAIFAAVLAPTHPAAAVAIGLTAAAAAWSRVRTAAHTPVQAYAYPPAIGAIAMLATLAARYLLA